MATIDEKPHKAEAAPLEGAISPEIMRVLNFAFLGMSLGMCQQLAMTMSPALDGPLLSQNGPHGAQMDTNFRAQPTIPHIEMKAPKPFGLT